jgi:hypothetical protein
VLTIAQFAAQLVKADVMGTHYGKERTGCSIHHSPGTFSYRGERRCVTIRTLVCQWCRIAHPMSSRLDTPNVQSVNCFRVTIGHGILHASLVGIAAISRDRQ